MKQEHTDLIIRETCYSQKDKKSTIFSNKKNNRLNPSPRESSRKSGSNTNTPSPQRQINYDHIESEYVPEIFISSRNTKPKIVTVSRDETPERRKAHPFSPQGRIQDNDDPYNQKV